MKYLGVNADWFENQQKYEVKKNKKTNDKKIMNELQLTNQEIKMRRKILLSKLYTEEAGLYEAELEMKNLAIAKER